MLHGVRDGTTRFVLNKQVAFVGKVSFLDGPAALGGIEVTVRGRRHPEGHRFPGGEHGGGPVMIAVSSPAFSVMEFPQALEMVAEHFQAWEVVAEGRHDLQAIEKQFLELDSLLRPGVLRPRPHERHQHRLPQPQDARGGDEGAARPPWGPAIAWAWTS